MHSKCFNIHGGIIVFYIVYKCTFGILQAQIAKPCVPEVSILFDEKEPSSTNKAKQGVSSNKDPNHLNQLAAQMFQRGPLKPVNRTTAELTRTQNNPSNDVMSSQNVALYFQPQAPKPHPSVTVSQVNTPGNKGPALVSGVPQTTVAPSQASIDQSGNRVMTHQASMGWTLPMLQNTVTSQAGMTQQYAQPNVMMYQYSNIAPNQMPRVMGPQMPYAMYQQPQPNMFPQNCPVTQQPAHFSPVNQGMVVSGNMGSLPQNVPGAYGLNPVQNRQVPGPPPIPHQITHPQYAHQQDHHAPVNHPTNVGSRQTQNEAPQQNIPQMPNNQKTIPTSTQPHGANKPINTSQPLGQPATPQQPFSTNQQQISQQSIQMKNSPLSPVLETSREASSRYHFDSSDQALHNSTLDSVLTSASTVPPEVLRLLQAQDAQLKELKSQLAGLLAKQNEPDVAKHETASLRTTATQMSAQSSPVKSRGENVGRDMCTTATNTSHWSINNSRNDSAMNDSVGLHTSSHNQSEISTQYTDLPGPRTNIDTQDIHSQMHREQVQFNGYHQDQSVQGHGVRGNIQGNGPYIQQGSPPGQQPNTSPVQTISDTMISLSELKIAEIQKQMQIQNQSQESILSDMIVDMPAYTSLSPDK